MGSVFHAAKRARLGHWRRWGPLEIAAVFHIAVQLYERFQPWQKVLVERELERRKAAERVTRPEDS